MERGLENQEEEEGKVFLPLYRKESYNLPSISLEDLALLAQDFVALPILSPEPPRRPPARPDAHYQQEPTPPHLHPLSLKDW